VIFWYQSGAIKTDEENKDNIAKKISEDSQRTVLATTCQIYPDSTTIQSINSLMLKHPDYSTMRSFFLGCPENNKNHFKTINHKQEEAKQVREEL
jgi:hypothetical protein